MKKYVVIVVLIAFFQSPLKAQRLEMDLSGTWDFEQTDKAFPPEKFTRSIPVPGLIDLAKPKIEGYDEIFMGDQEPKYSWYKKEFYLTDEHKGKKAILSLLKSRFNTQVIINGIDVGTFIQTATPIEVELTNYLRDNGKNELLIRIDDIDRIDRKSAFSMDIEQFTYIPGIWDNVFISFTGPVRIAKSLCLPFLDEGKVKVKMLLENHDDKIKREFSLLEYDTKVSAFVRERKSKKVVTDPVEINTSVECLHQQEAELEIPMNEINPWTPDSPFLYEVVITTEVEGVETDRISETLGMRDFTTRGRYFFLNGEETMLFGSNIGLSRFMGDPEREGLIWDREWVERFLVEIPRKLGWNSFRLSLGLAPDFWYDLADEHGIMIQNEWQMWKNRGWDLQIEEEFKDWVWSDGSHPSIVIWDAMNESRHDYIGNKIIPRMKALDPTRIWDAGYMNEHNMSVNEMDEPHFYPLMFTQRTDKEKVKNSRENYRFGKLHIEDNFFDRTKYAGVPQVVNEYGWVWLNRDGTPAFLSKGMTDPDERLPQKHYFKGVNDWENKQDRTPGLYEYYTGQNEDPQKNWDFNAYYIQLQTEMLRVREDISGIMGFCYLTFNKGYTGDWFLNPIKDLVPSETLKWQYHCFAPFAVFIDLEDGRYLKNSHTFRPGEQYSISLEGINDLPQKKEGDLSVKVLTLDNQITFIDSMKISLSPHSGKSLCLNVKMPEKPGGYLLVSELKTKNSPIQISRRYIRVGQTNENTVFPALSPGVLQDLNMKD